MALKHDSIAVAIAQPQQDRIVVRCRIWNPQEQGVDIAEVEAHLKTLASTYQVHEFAYDPSFFQRSAEALADDGLPMIEFPQSAQRMVPACGNAYELIVAGKVAHDGSPSLTDHVLSAAQRMTEQGWRLSKGKSKRKIDGCIALVLALDRATKRQRLEAAPTVLNIWS
jgi:phage terminase large subunit-like protein